MNKRFKLALVLICGFMLIISAGCGSKTDNNQNQNNQNMNHTNMPEMDHSKMKMEEKSNN